MRKQSQIVNNFFTLASIIIIGVTLTLYVNYIVKDPNEPAKKIVKKQITKLECEEDNFTTYKVFNQKLLDSSQKALEKGFYKLQGGYIKSEYSKSIIEDYISLKELDSFYEKSIGINPKKDINKFLTIKYEIIENDKKNPNKKAKECKLYSGSVITSFRANSNEIFRFYTDFRLYDKEEIASRIDCAIKVYKNHGR